MGAREQFEANGTYSDGVIRDLTTQVTWSSSDANALVVSNIAFQEGLARALSVTFSTVSRWENGHVLPSKLAWRALQQLANARGCPLDVEAPHDSR